MKFFCVFFLAVAVEYFWFLFLLAAVDYYFYPKRIECKRVWVQFNSVQIAYTRESQLYRRWRVGFAIRQPGIQSQGAPRPINAFVPPGSYGAWVTSVEDYRGIACSRKMAGVRTTGCRRARTASRLVPAVCLGNIEALLVIKSQIHLRSPWHLH